MASWPAGHAARLQHACLLLGSLPVQAPAAWHAPAVPVQPLRHSCTPACSQGDVRPYRPVPASAHNAGRWPSSRHSPAHCHTLPHTVPHTATQCAALQAQLCPPSGTPPLTTSLHMARPRSPPHSTWHVAEQAQQPASHARQAARRAQPHQQQRSRQRLLLPCIHPGRRHPHRCRQGQGAARQAA